MKTILYFSPVHDFVGGAEISLRTMLESLDRTCYRPIVLFDHEGQFSAWLKEQGIEYHIVPTSWIRTSDIFNLWLVGWQIMRKFKAYGLSHIHANSKLGFHCAGISGWLLRVPVIVHWRDAEFQAGDRFFFWWWRKQIKIVAVSEYVKTLLTQFLPDTKITVLYDPPGSHAVRKVLPAEIQTTRQRWRVGGDDLVLGMSSRLVSWKGHRLAIQAVAELKDPGIKLVIAGVGPDPDEPNYREELINIIEQYSLSEQIRLIGSPPDMAVFLASVDIVLALSDREPYGLIVPEAMAQEKPVIAVREGGFIETIKDGLDGLLVGKKPNLVVDGINRLKNNVALRTRCGQEGRKKIERQFGAGKFRAELSELYSGSVFE